MQSFFYTGNSISFIQYGLASDGYTRYFPYSPGRFSQPSSCRIQQPYAYEFCGVLNETSECSGNPAYTSVGYPSYDARCRSWFNFGLHGNDSHAYFQYPRKSSSGAYVTTVATPLQNGTEFSGVLIFNVLSSRLSDAINQNGKILDSGYTYLIDAENPDFIVIHPYATGTCNQVLCAEGFTDIEYIDFYSSVLHPIMLISQGNSTVEVSKTYFKSGSLWRLDYSVIEYDTATYAVIVTVPQSDIEKSSNDIVNSINKTVLAMIFSFALCMAALTIVFICLVRLMTYTIVNPINELRSLCSMVTSDDLSGLVPTNPHSYDMKILLDAFSSVMVALRFGSDSYARGDPNRAYTVFKEALTLFSKTQNIRGMGASENNLASVEMSFSKFTESEEHFNNAINHAQDMITSLESNANSSPTELMKLRRILSDRRGNLALLYLEQNNFGKAFKILEEAIQDDKHRGYIRGCVVKQGTLGHYYLRQREMHEAQRIFQSALNFVNRRDEELYDCDWNDDEAAVAKQIAMYNMAYYNEVSCDNNSPRQIAGSNKPTTSIPINKRSQVIGPYIEALVQPTHMHTQTVTKIFIQLFNLFQSWHSSQDMNSLQEICEANDIKLNDKDSKGGRTGNKRVVFCLDHSGSMSGSKIKAAVSNLQNIIDEHIQLTDHFMLISFSTYVKLEVSLGLKDGRETLVANTLKGLLSPSGSTAFYDAIDTAISHLHSESPNDWIIALTDGEDTSSKLTHSGLMTKLHNLKDTSLIIIAVGVECRLNELESLAKATKQGLCIPASADAKGITEAFGKVVAVIQGQVILEDL
jgi:uncharacterized protein YegL